MLFMKSLIFNIIIEKYDKKYIYISIDLIIVVSQGMRWTYLTEIEYYIKFTNIFEAFVQWLHEHYMN